MTTTTTKTKTILLNFADHPHEEPIRYEITFDGGEFLRVRMKLKTSRKASEVEYMLRKQSDGTLVNNFGVRFIVAKADRRTKKFTIRGNGIDGRFEKKFATLAELQNFVRKHWEGVDYIDGAAEFHSDYVRFTLFGATLDDLGARGGDYGTDGYWNWSWKQLDETVAADDKRAALDALPLADLPEVNVCIVGNPAVDGICGDPECVCAPGELTFDDAELDALRAGFLQTWSAIGHDIFQAMDTGATEFTQLNVMTLLRGEVVEAILDANYLEAYGQLDAALLAKFRTLSYYAQTKLGMIAFPRERYS